MINPEKIWSSPKLPTLPAVAIQLLELSQDPEAAISELAQTIKLDPAITAKILKATNSTYFSFRSEVASIDRAVPLLGKTMVTSLALSFSLVEAAMTTGPLSSHYKDYWLKSVTQAVAAELLGEKVGGPSPFFLAGLLADLGRLAMLKTLGQEYAQVLEQAEASKRSSLEVEHEVFGVDSVEIGAKLMERWKLPPQIIQAAQARKWTVEELAQHNEKESEKLLRVNAVASAVGDYFCSANKGPALERLREATSHFFQMSEEELDLFLEQVKERMEAAAGTFSVNAEDLQDPVELMALANEHLAQLAVQVHVASTQAEERQKIAEEENHRLIEQNQQLQKQAIRDPLTKIYNRNFFEDALAREVHRCQRTADPIAVIFSDIDHFKKLNDTYGHPFGDQVLKQIAEVFQSALRTSDVLARYGGEEFVIMAVQATEKGLCKVVERIRSSVENHEIFFEGKRVPVTVSIGAAIAIPGRNDEEIGNQLVAEADEAMYESKRSGRNRTTVRCLMREDERRLASLTNQRRFSRWLVDRKILDILTASKVLLSCQTRSTTLGEMACHYRVLTEECVQKILDEQQTTQERFGEASLRLGLLNEQQLAQLLAWQDEDPRTFANQLVESGALGSQETEMVLAKYLAESDIQPMASAKREVVSVP